MNIELFEGFSHHFEYIIHCFMASIVSNWKSAFNLIEDHLYIMNHFSLFSRFFVFWEFDYDGSRCGYLWIYPIWSFWTLGSYLSIYMIFFTKFGTFSSNIYAGVCDCAYSLWGSSSFSSSFFFFFCLIRFSDWIISIDLLQIYWLFSSFCSNTLLSPSGEVFMLVIVYIYINTHTHTCTHI